MEEAKLSHASSRLDELGAPNALGAPVEKDNLTSHEQVIRAREPGEEIRDCRGIRCGATERGCLSSVARPSSLSRTEIVMGEMMTPGATALRAIPLLAQVSDGAF